MSEGRYRKGIWMELGKYDAGFSFLFAIQVERFVIVLLFSLLVIA